MDYTLRHWDALYRYTENGWLCIDNNAVKRELRSITVGRKNWLFCGSDRGGRAARVHFSLIASCRRSGLDPFLYLRDLLTKLPKLGSAADVERSIQVAWARDAILADVNSPRKTRHNK